MSLSVESIARIAYAADCELFRVRTPEPSVLAWSQLDEPQQDRLRERVALHLADEDDVDREPVRDELFAAIVDALNDEPGDAPLRLDERHPSIAGVLKYLEVNPNLPAPQAAVAQFARLIAVAWADVLPETPETTVALRKLLEATDAAVRASLDLDDDGDGPVPADPQGATLGVLTSIDGGADADEVRADVEHALGETRRSA